MSSIMIWRIWNIIRRCLAVRLCRDIPNVPRLVFAVKELMELGKPPEQATEDDLIKWSPSIVYSGIHHSEIDVTGGIELKAKRCRSGKFRH